MISDSKFPLSSKHGAQVTESLSRSVEAIELWLTFYLIDSLHVDPEEIDVQKPFTYYGLVSTEAVTMVGEMEEWLGYPLEPTLAWDYPTIAAVAEFLGNGDEASFDSEAADPAEVGDVSDMVSDIERLSEEEVRAALNETD